MMVTRTHDATYLYLTDEPTAVARTVSLSGLIAVDLDEQGQPVGVEFAVPVEKISDAMVKRVVNQYPRIFDSSAEDPSRLLIHA